MPSPSLPKEFVVIDESGDPGPLGERIYILAAMHAGEAALHELRSHLTSFRYHSGFTKEFKDARWAREGWKPDERLDHFLGAVADLSDEGALTTTAVWLDKEEYKKNNGPYLRGVEGDTTRFRHFQLRRLLETHVGRRKWIEATDLVIDRWAMTNEQRRNLETYLSENFRLRPVPWITLVDSVYCDFVQVVDVLTRIVRRCVTNVASEEERALCARLADVRHLRGGLYAP